MTRRDLYVSAIIGFISGFFLWWILTKYFTFGQIEWGSFIYDYIHGYGDGLEVIILMIVMGFLFPFGLFVASFLLAQWFSGIRKFAKFAAVGVMNTLVDAGILIFLASSSAVYTGIQIGGYNMISSSIALINSYFWNKLWVFERKDSKNKYEFIEFISVTIIGLLLNSGIVYIITTFIRPSGGLGSVADDKWLLVAKAAATAVTLFWNFIGYKLIVFKVREKTIA